MLLATEPIWEDDSFDLGVNHGNRGMEISTGQRAVAGGGVWESPCKAQRRAAPVTRIQPVIDSSSRQSRPIYAMEDANPVRGAGTGEGRVAAAPSLAPVTEQPAYTGMTGRRDRRDRFNPPPEVLSQRSHTRQRTELDCRESGSEQGARPTMNRPGRNGEGSKRRREASFVESVPVKKGEQSNTVALLRTTRPAASWDL